MAVKAAMVPCRQIHVMVLETVQVSQSRSTHNVVPAPCLVNFHRLFLDGLKFAESQKVSNPQSLKRSQFETLELETFPESQKVSIS